MFRIYNRDACLKYAKTWAMSRNPIYFDFDTLGGDCTNYVSQCVFAGANIMNYSIENGWFYISPSNRSPSWTSTESLYHFLINNKKNGPFGKIIPTEDASVGDIIQFGNNNKFFHSAIVVGNTNGIYVAAHTNDCYMRKLSTYSHPKVRCIHIEGMRIL